MTNKEFDNVHDDREESVEVEGLTDDTLVVETAEPAKTETFETVESATFEETPDPDELSQRTEEVVEEIDKIEAAYQIDDDIPGTEHVYVEEEVQERTVPAGSKRDYPAQGPDWAQATPLPAAPDQRPPYTPNGSDTYDSPSVLQSAVAKVGRTSGDAPIKVGLLIWAVILGILGVLTVVGGIAAPVNIQALFTTMLVVAGIGFIVLAIAQNQKKPVQGTAQPASQGRPPQQFTQGQPAQSGQPGPYQPASQPRAGHHGQPHHAGYTPGQHQQPGYPQNQPGTYPPGAPYASGAPMPRNQEYAQAPGYPRGQGYPHGQYFGNPQEPGKPQA